jgi:hypothetical protein
MAQSVRLSDTLVKEANPDLSYEMIRGILLAKAEIGNGLVDDYEFDH